jgi:hypothetical protein
MTSSAFETYDAKKTSAEPGVAELLAVEKATLETLQVDDSIHEYRVYKRRWIGVAALFLLNVSAGTSFRL